MPIFSKVSQTHFKLSEKGICYENLLLKVGYAVQWS